mgnify:CR=1 FL=1
MRGLRMGILGVSSGGGPPSPPPPVITSILSVSPVVTAATPTGTSVASAAFTPTAGSVLLVGIASRATNALTSATTLTDNTSGALTWTLIKETYLNDGVAPRLRGAVFKCVVPGTPPTGVVLTGGQAQALYLNMTMLEMIGGSSTITNIAPDAIDLTSGDPAATLPSVPAGNDGGIMLAIGQGNSIGTAPAGSTVIGNTGNTSLLRSFFCVFASGAPQVAQWVSYNTKSIGIYFAVSPAG